MNRRIKQVWLLAILSSFLLIGLQTYWLYNSVTYSIQTEKDSIKDNQEAEIKADKEAEIQAVTVTGHRPMYKMRNETLVTHVRNTPLAK